MPFLCNKSLGSFIKKRISIILILFISLLLFYKLTRPIWHPIKVKFSGAQTEEQTVQRIAKATISNDQSLASIPTPQKLSILAFKEERQLEVWDSSQEKPVLLKTFPFTAFSGTLGPKLREGDGQIPEGLYKIEYLNPNSSYHLSMKINFPNAFDRRKARKEKRTRPGTNIFIHGKAVTIGCIPIGDSAIEELFYIVSKTGKKNVDVIISPYDMRLGIKKLEIPNIIWEDELYEKIKSQLLFFSP